MALDLEIIFPNGGFMNCIQAYGNRMLGKPLLAIVFIVLLLGFSRCSKNPISSSNDYNKLPVLATIQGMAKLGPSDSGSALDSITHMLGECNNPRVALFWNTEKVYSPGANIPLFYADSSGYAAPMPPTATPAVSVKTQWPLRFSAHLIDVPESEIPGKSLGFAQCGCMLLFNDTDHDGICRLPFNVEALNKAKELLWLNNSALSVSDSQKSALIKGYLCDYLRPALIRNAGGDWLFAVWQPLQTQENGGHEEWRFAFANQPYLDYMRVSYPNPAMDTLHPGFQVFNYSFGAANATQQGMILSSINCEAFNFNLKVITLSNLNAYIDTIMTELSYFDGDIL